jgi:hypothetical protein
MFTVYFMKIGQMLPKIEGEKWNADLVNSLHFNTRGNQCKKWANIDQNK